MYFYYYYFLHFFVAYIYVLFCQLWHSISSVFLIKISFTFTEQCKLNQKCYHYDDKNIRHLFNEDYNYIVGLPSILPIGLCLIATVQYLCNLAQ